MSSPKLFPFSCFFFVWLLLSCNQEDVESVALRDVQIQYNEDDAALQEYLRSHYFNYEAFEEAPNNYSLRIEIDTIAGENTNKIPLLDQVKSKAIEITDSDGNIIDHKLYYLVVRKGNGAQPTKVDSTYVRYQGSLLDGSVFDKRELPLWFNLPDLVPGFREGIPEFRSGSFSENPDGTFRFFDFGQGALFLPSGLGYYSNAQSGIPAYSPLIFTFSLFAINPADHDGDGILSREEDINNDGNPFNDDTDGDGIANMYDDDDDGDGVLTRIELDLDENGSPGDSDGDGIPNHLDADSAN
ncbi:MAG: hypothetical protein ACON47_05980 [Flavobacteriaceae bacterium]